MKYLPLVVVLLAAPAFAEDVPQQAEKPASEAQAIPTPTPTPPPSPATQAAPAQPTAWNIEGLDANDIATLNEALENLPMKVYRQFTNRLQQKIKPVK
jgi:hypothetical protein